MTRSVLLARPHPFIVSEMRPWLEGAGFSVSKPELASDLPMLAKGCTRAVISLALSSPVGLSADEVVQILRREAPGARLLFAALLPFDKARPALEKLAAQMATASGGEPITLVDIGASDSPASSALGRHTTLSYLSKDDLADPTRKQWAARQLSRHFA